MLRKGSDAEFILNRFEQERFKPDLIILENSNSARRKKLIREISKTKNISRLLMLDIPALVLFDFVQRKLMLKKNKVRNSKQKFRKVESVNDSAFLSEITSLKPDYVLNFGTSIYKEETLTQIEVPVLNWHTGILPRYRNVHTDFWAYVNSETDCLGVSIFHVDSGIDTGRVIWTNRSFRSDSENLWVIKRRNLEIVASSMIQFGKDPASFTGAPLLSRNQKPLVCRTPTSIDIFSYLIMEVRKIASRRN